VSSILGLDAWSSIASIVVIGDSNSEGTGATAVSTRWQQVLQERLRSRLQHPGAAGAAVPYISASPRVTPPLAGYGRTATAGVTQGSFGLGLRAAVVPAGESVTFTFDGTRAKLYGTKGPSVGRYSIRLDGAAEVVVDGFNSGSIVSGQLIWDSGPLAAGTHTVQVARAASTTISPGNVFPEGLMVYNGDEAAGVRVVDAARHGTTVGSFTGSTAWHTAFGAIEGKRLLILAPGANDVTGGTTATAFRAGVEALIAAARSAGFSGTVLLLKMPKRGSADPALWADYMAQLDAVDAADADVVTLDLRARIPDQGTPEAVVLGLYVDEVHFSDAGQALIASVIGEAILAAGWDEPTLPVQVQAAFGADLTADPGSWSWTDLSSRLRAEPIRIRAGKSSGARQVSPGTCTVTLDNDDAALTPLHPMSPYWPNVEMGTPLRVSVQWAGVWYERFAGFADQWEPTYLPTGVPGEMSSAVRVTCSGILRRLQQGEQSAPSAMRRTIAASGPVVYWPAEDGQAASQAGSTTTDAGPLVVTGAVEFRPVDDYVAFTGFTTRYGTTALADLAGGGQLRGDLPAAAVAATAAGAWTVHAAMVVDTLSTLSGDVVVAEWTTAGGTYTRWQIKVTTASRTQVIAFTAAGAATTLIDHGSASPTFHHYAVSASLSGGTVTVRLQTSYTTQTTTFGGSLGGVTAITLNAASTTSSSEMPAGHIAVWAAAPIPIRITSVEESDGTFVREARRSFDLESATGRLARLAGEDGVAMDMPAVADDAIQRMGWQEAGTRLELYQECVEVDGGLLFEQGYGLGYLPRAARYNPPVALSIDLSTYAVTRASSDPLVPIYDDQDIRNRWTVQRREGSFAVAEDLASQRRGVYSDSVELNLASDGQLADQAGWRLHLTAVADLREATFPIDLAANPELVAGWLSCGVGSRIVRTNPPAQYRPGDIDRLVEGWTETIGPRSWLVQVTPSPAEPWRVAEVNGEQRVAADGTTLAAPVTAGALTMQITSTAASGPWTTSPGSFPLDVRVGGERVTLSAITGSGLTQTATVSARGVNGVTRSWPAGTEVDVWLPAVVAL
jgi:lysophospholipase L1-like esterase